MKIVLLLLALLFCIGLSCRQTSKELERISVQKDVKMQQISTVLLPTVDVVATRS